MSSAFCYNGVEAVLLLRIVRGGTVPDIRPMTKHHTVQLCPQKGNGVKPQR